MSNKKIGIKRTLIKLIQMETTEFLRASCIVLNFSKIYPIIR